MKNNNEINQIFCKNVKAIMKAEDIRQKELAYELGIAQNLFCQKINCYEKAKFNLYQISKIAQYLNTPLEWLLTPNAFYQETKNEKKSN